MDGRSPLTFLRGFVPRSDHHEPGQVAGLVLTTVGRHLAADTVDMPSLVSLMSMLAIAAVT